ncbi:uncharacterized protein CMC5_026350 [Chondromyces crocatus]|uniref:Cytochrome c domain-containing protein n=2 Tax=Chondromyces crocatus TaxID=52 RepID=A0A0K1ED33_CHOCO|nr:uncharacterized protein CMC5_026350 [Chondromyces crocatus]
MGDRFPHRYPLGVDQHCARRAALTVAMTAAALWLATPPATARAEEGEPPEIQAQRLVHMLTYVGADYGAAVRDGTIISQLEYDEQLDLLTDAAKIAAHLTTGGSKEGAGIPPGIAALREKIEARAPQPDVAEAATLVARDVEATFHLADAPLVPPDPALAATLFATHCATCHGDTGRADTPRAETLIPRPTDFHDPEIVDGMSPLRAVTTTRFGVPGTAMAPFPFFTEEERWSLGFHLIGLRHAATRPSEAPLPSYTFIELALRSDDDLRHDLAARGVPEADRPAALAALRQRAPLDPAGTMRPLTRARAHITRALTATRAGDRSAARAPLATAASLALTAAPAPLRARGIDPTRLDDRLLGARTALDQDADPDALESALSALLREATYADVSLAATAPPSPRDQALTAASITLRNGIGAALGAAALLGATHRPRRAHLLLLLTLLGGAAASWATRALQHHLLGVLGLSALLTAALTTTASLQLLTSRETRLHADPRTEQEQTKAPLPPLLLVASCLGIATWSFSTLATGTLPLLAADGALGAITSGTLVATITVLLIAHLLGRATTRPSSPSQAHLRAGLTLLGALAFTALGASALERADHLPLPLIPLPRIPLLDTRPTLSTALAGMLVLFVWGLALLLRRNGDATEHVDPQ